MANRANNHSPHSQQPSGSGLQLGAHPGLLRNFQNSPSPGRGGLAGRRAAPKFNIRDIIGPDGGGGADGAGLARGVPPTEMPARRPPAATGSPFSNFNKIVYVPVSYVLFV